MQGIYAKGKKKDLGIYIYTCTYFKYLENTYKYLVVLTIMACDMRSRTISPVVWSIMRMHSLATGLWFPLKTVCAVPAPSTCGTVTVTWWLPSTSTVPIFCLSTLAGLKSSVIGRARNNNFCLVELKQDLLIMPKRFLVVFCSSLWIYTYLNSLILLVVWTFLLNQSIPSTKK